MEIIGEEKQSKNKDFHGRSLKSLKQGIGRLLGRRSVTITEYDPTYKVVYLGNVLTGWAKGDSCTEKPLNTLWKNYTSNSKPDVHMKLIVTQSGLKAITKEHGLTEYWSHRITFCSAPADLPKIFCWVYRHEGRKLKQELRCHAVLCAKESVARQIANQLQARLTQALIEFKRDKLSRQNARLSLANSVYENPSLPRRKILLSTGCQNYRPPLERSKSAPKLMAIEESLEEEAAAVAAAAAAANECADDGDTCKRLSKRVDPRSRFATCRNLSYSNRGSGSSRMGGLHGLRVRSATTVNLLPVAPCTTTATATTAAVAATAAAGQTTATATPTTKIASTEASSVCCRDRNNGRVNENSSQFDENNVRTVANDDHGSDDDDDDCGGDGDVNVVEPNPFGCNRDCETEPHESESLLEAFVRGMALKEQQRNGCADERQSIVDRNEKMATTPPSPMATATDINENICDASVSKDVRKFVLQNITTDVATTTTTTTTITAAITTSCSAGQHQATLPCPSYQDSVAASGRYDERLPPPLYDEVVSSSQQISQPAGKFDSLVRSRRKMFENGGVQTTTATTTTTTTTNNDGDERRRTSSFVVNGNSSTTAVAPKDLVKSRRKLFENGEKMALPNNAVATTTTTTTTTATAAIVGGGCGSGGDTDSALHFDFSGDEQRDSLECVGYGADDDSSTTPSLQSISSCSDTSSPRDIKLEYAKNYDLDLLWEEDSDESGFVESIGQEANDDKIRDLPHHHLMKNCLLSSSKSRCVEV